MNLKDFLVSRDSPPELYWSLVLEKGWAQAGVWYIGEEKAEVVSVGPGAAWTTDEELTEAADTALSSAVQDLPENYKEPNKTVFGVPNSWVKNGEISEEYLAKIKKLCTDLSLTPVGFVILPEAIAHYYKSEEGSPLNAIILGLSAGSLEISVFKLGNLIGTTEVSRSVSIVEDVIEGLSRFEGAAPLPSRFIVYDGKDAELTEAKEILLQASWDGIEKVKFLHTPKAEILDSDKKVIATSLAGAAEIGHVSQVDEPKPVQEPEPVKIETPPAPVMPEAPIPEPEAPTGATPEDMGFTVENVIPVQTPKPFIPVSPSPISNPNPISDNSVQKYFQKTKNFFRSFSVKPNAAPKIKNNTLIGILIVTVLLVIGGALAWWFIPKAKITVFVTPRRFEEPVNLTFSPNGNFDVATGTIPATVITDQVKGDKTKAATGVKLIGNKATGTVQIANGNGNAINLSVGTIITSSAGLKFVTASEASISGQLLPGSPGTATVNVTAGDIGSQYNLAKGEVFTIGNYSKAMVAGTSAADFSGGSSQEITAVSASDETSLETDLKNELTQNAVNDISGKVDSDKVFVTDLAGTVTTSETFDHKVGDSADSVKLTLGLSATGLGADKAKLIEYAISVLKDKIPQGYSLKDDQIDFKFKFSGIVNGNYIYSATVGANFLPQVEAQKIINQITGSSPAVAQNFLDSIPGFDHAEVVLTPKLPSFLGTLPRVAKNITLIVTAE
jgi:hypothetical protein